MRFVAKGWDFPWQTLIAILLSARTRDEVTTEVAEKLFLKYSSLELLAHAKLFSLEQILRPVNFYKTKSQHVLALAKILFSDFEGAVPRDVSVLVSLPGVGRKTAQVFLAQYDVPAIGVDTHVAFISQYLGWTSFSDPLKIEQDLQRVFPQKYWTLVNLFCVRFGKTYLSRAEKTFLLDQLKNASFFEQKS